jgi:hypothetical protein
MYAHGAIKHAHGAKIYLTALEGAEIIPGKRKRSDTRIKPLTLTNGHGRYMTVTPERALAAVSEVKSSPGSRSGLKYPLGLLESSRYNSFSRRRRWEWL